MITAPKIYKMRVAFTVDGPWDHQRIFAALRQAVLKSALPFEPAKVNKHWPRLAYGPALGYGQYSTAEYADLYFSVPVRAEDALTALRAAAPQGVQFLRAVRVPYALPSVSQLAQVCLYAVRVNFEAYAPPAAEAFFSGKHIYITSVAPNGMKMQQDLRPFVVSAERPEKDVLKLLLQQVADKSTKPEWLVAAWLGLEIAPQEQFTLPDFKFTREALYWRDAAAELHPLL